MRQFKDKTVREIFLLLEPHELNRLVYDAIKKNGYNFDEKEIELKYDFIEEGSPAYKTNKVKCSIKILKEMPTQ